MKYQIFILIDLIKIIKLKGNLQIMIKYQKKKFDKIDEYKFIDIFEIDIILNII